MDRLHESHARSGLPASGGEPPSHPLPETHGQTGLADASAVDSKPTQPGPTPRRWQPLSSAAGDKWREPAPGPTESTDTWLLSYLDMMTLLLVLMLVMLSLAGQRQENASSAAAEQSEAVVAKATQAMQGRQGVLSGGSGLLPGGDGLLPGVAAPVNESGHDLNLEGLGDDIDVIVTGQTVSFRINSEILFQSGGADLGREGLVLLRKLVPVFGDNDYRVVVHGHTDSVPIGNHRFPSNWELSGARAGSVVRYLQANGLAGVRLSAIGHADTQPIADNATAAGRASNRRVELVVETGAERQP